MKRMPAAQLPRMRTQGLVIDELPNEVLVYDLERHTAHCLNSTAALVWQLCDGHTTPAEIARRLRTKLDAPATDQKLNQDLVFLALRQLDQLHLLDQAIVLPANAAGLSRRELVRRLGIAAAVALPLVTSILAPTAVEAATCIPTGSACSGTIMCCSMLGCDTNTNLCR